MRSNASKPSELPTYAILVSPSGEILDVRTHQMRGNVAAARLKGRTYADACAQKFRSSIKSLLNRQRQLLSVVMPPPTLESDSWFAVVGVPLGPSKEGGALFVHMDISPWVGGHVEARFAEAKMPTELSQVLIQSAMASTFLTDKPSARPANEKNSYDGVESLTARQREVLKLIGEGKSNVEIANDLSCSLNTVKRHVTAVLQKLRLPNRTRAAMLVNQISTVPKA